MKYVNSNCQLQDQSFDMDFLLYDKSLVNTIRYKMKYTNSEGRPRDFDIYIPKEVFLGVRVPNKILLRIAAEL